MIPKESSSEIRILVVDDEELVRHQLRHFLGFTFETTSEVKISMDFVSSAQDAIKLIDKGTPFDIVICDYNMPHGNGDLVAGHLDHKNQGSYGSPIKFIFFTGCMGLTIPDYKNIEVKVIEKSNLRGLKKMLTRQSWKVEMGGR